MNLEMILVKKELKLKDDTVLISDNENLSYEKSSDYYWECTLSENIISTDVPINIIKKFIPDCISGKKLYVIAYGFTSDFHYYTNCNTGLYVFTGLNQTPTNVVSFNIP